MTDVSKKDRDASRRYLDVELTSAQLLALHTTEVEVIPAPPAGEAVVVEGLVAFMDYGGTQYASVGSSDDISLYYTASSAGGELLTIETTGLLDGTADKVKYKSNLETQVTPVAAAPVVAKLGGAITTGNSPLRLRVYFRRIPTVIAAPAA